MMPVMDGWEVLQVLHANPVTHLIPIIIMTALSERENMREGMNLGADDYITKPFTRIELINAIKSRLKKRELSIEQTENALNELRRNIITNLPHELNTPLNAMVGYGQLLKEYHDSFNESELKEIGENIYDSSMRLHRLIQNYLIYAQLELSKESFHPTKLYEASAICSDVAQTIALKYNRVNDLQFVPCAGAIKIFENEFKKILEETIDNAFKFSLPNTPVQIICKIVDQQFLITITDQGIGFPTEKFDKVGAYMQFDRHAMEQQGSGLGLIIAKRLTTLFNGQLKLGAPMAKGTCISIEFPANEQ
jgi:signal transduction histidine kinase